MSEHILMLFLSRILTVGEERSKYATGGKKNPEKRRIFWYWIRITNISVGGFFLSISLFCPMKRAPIGAMTFIQ